MCMFTMRAWLIVVENSYERHDAPIREFAGARNMESVLGCERRLGFLGGLRLR